MNVLESPATPSVLDRIVQEVMAPFVKRARTRDLEEIVKEDMLAIGNNQYKPLGRLKHIFFEPDDMNVDNLQAFKDQTGLPVPMIMWPQNQTSSATGRTLRGAPPLGLTLNDDHILICQRLGQLPALVDPRAKRPDAVPLITGGALFPEDWQAPMVQQDASLLSCGRITLKGGWRYHIIQPVTQIGIYGNDGNMFSIGFEADSQGRKTTLLLPIVDEMPVSNIPNWPAFLVYGKWQASTQEGRGAQFHGGNGGSFA